jgi:peptidoglycan/xylan/chitin deacetylase (PgdA/CDA1 family)
MQQSGLVSFGSHTMHHPVLACLDNADDLRYELEASRQALQQRLGTAVSTFAYPIGKEAHVSHAAVRAVGDAGYSWAVTAMPGFNTPASHPLLLRRVLAEERRHWSVVAAELCGIWSYLSPFWKFLLGE